MVAENNLDLSTLDGLSPAEKEYALKILQQYASEGASELFNDLKYSDYEEIPVDIMTFMHDKRYLGNALYNKEGKFTIFPYWENKLQEIFPTNVDTAYNTVVLTGAIGLGKSTIAVICMLYMLYRLLCLKDPYLFYGLQPIDKITISSMNITLENARGVAMDKMNQMILSSEWFMSHGEMCGTVNLEYRPNKHIEVIAASSNNQVIGRALFCLSGDTVIQTTEGPHMLQELVNKSIQVPTWNNNSNKIELSHFCYVQPTVKSCEEIIIELSDGTLVKCTPNHEFLTTQGIYKRADQLTTEDELEEGAICDLQ